MRSYRNLDGVQVEVSEEHLDTAVKIKRELQMASPSHRCNWNQHKKLMEVEGYLDSESSENYRLLIKNYQSSTGQLDSKEKHVDLVATSKLESIKQATGEMFFTKREVQLEAQKLGRLKRELTLFGVVAEEVRDALINELQTVIPDWSLSPRLPEGKHKMVIGYSDWHIGGIVVNVNGNSYNYDIAKDRAGKFLEEVIRLAKFYNITEVVVVALGDLTEHVSMRNQQSHEAEFKLSKQITKAFELVRDTLMNLTKHFNVTYMGISGNHDRINGDKNDNLDGDSTAFLINYMVQVFAENSLIPRLTYVEADNILYSAVIEVNGSKIKFVHGDNEGTGTNILALHQQMDDEGYSAIVMGHLHHYHVKEVGRNKYLAWFGSLKANDNHAKKGKYSSDPSQGVIIVDENGMLNLMRIGL